MPQGLSEDGWILGVLGGMGPLATADFYEKLILATGADTDQRHFPVMICGDPRIPDRTAALETGSADTVMQALLRKVRRLERAGAAALAMPCNTAHFWLAALRRETDRPWISMLDATARRARAQVGNGGRLVVLGTMATMRRGLYADALLSEGLAIVGLTSAEEERCAAAIADVKAGRLARGRGTLLALCGDFRSRCDGAILACTELPLIAPTAQEHDAPLIDATSALAEACVAWFRARNLIENGSTA